MMFAAAQVDLWLAREDRMRAPALVEQLERHLSPDDRQRVQRMRFPEGQQEQRMTRALARHALSHYLPELKPADWRFESSELGRPSVARDMPAEARRLQFNLGHSDGLVVMAVGLMPELGVDVERITEDVPLEVARRYFSTREIAALDALPDADKPRRFQRLWTLKESYLKAVGTGISGGLGSMTFHFDESGVRFERDGDEEAARWQFREITVDDRYRVAVACLCRDTGATLQVRMRDFPARELSGQE
jgi:4'-phosphopantetheinyl transferase